MIGVDVVRMAGSYAQKEMLKSRRENETDLRQLCLYASIIELSRSILLRPILSFDNTNYRILLDSLV